MTAFEPTDRLYTSWNSELTNVNPIEERLLLGDTIYSSNSIIKNSPYRCNTIPGILVFDGRTFGRNSITKLWDLLIFLLLTIRIFLLNLQPL